MVAGAENDGEPAAERDSVASADTLGDGEADGEAPGVADGAADALAPLLSDALAAAVRVGEAGAV